MKRPQLEEILRAAGALTGRKEFILFGSQIVHALTPAPPVEVLISRECDIWINQEPDIEGLLKRELGPESSFRKAKGVYLDALPPDLPLLPPGWESRLLDMKVDEITVRCLEIHDLVVTKLAAGRLKDYEFIAAIFTAGLADKGEVVRRIQMLRELHTQAGLLARLRIATEATDVNP